MEKLSNAAPVLLDVRGLSHRFQTNRRKSTIYAVENLSLSIEESQIVGLVGESGCGKSTTIRAIAQLYRPYQGEVWFEGRDLCKLSGRELIAARRHLQLVFQDPSQSLNPQLTVGQIIAEPLIIQRSSGLIKLSSVDIRATVAEMMEAVGLSAQLRGRYPHEFSGGQQQRVAIARALVVKPRLILLDEPISALDVSIQAQVVNLLEQLQQDLKLSYLFVAHDLAMVRYLCQQTIVMYLGHVVELAPSEQLYSQPLHPYTVSLLQSIPIPDPKRRKIQAPLLKGEVSSPDQLSDSCPFALRCPQAFERCHQHKPSLQAVGQQQGVACWLYQT